MVNPVMRKPLIITALILFNLISQAQTPVGTWSDHLNYNTVKSIAVGSKEVYASTGSSLMVYNREFERALYARQFFYLHKLLQV